MQVTCLKSAFKAHKWPVLIDRIQYGINEFSFSCSCLIFFIYMYTLICTSQVPDIHFSSKNYCYLIIENVVHLTLITCTVSTS